ASFAQQTKPTPKTPTDKPQTGRGPIVLNGGGGGGSLYIDNQSAGTQTPGNFWIDGAGQALKFIAGSFNGADAFGNTGSLYVDGNGWGIRFGSGFLPDIARINNTGIGI